MEMNIANSGASKTLPTHLPLPELVPLSCTVSDNTNLAPCGATAAVALASVAMS
jgi:hypothetical protein